MKLITKDFVKQLIDSDESLKNFDQKEAEALFTLHEGTQTCFSRINSGFVCSDEIALKTVEDGQFLFALDNLKSSLSGSKWHGLVSSNPEEFVKARYRMLSACVVQNIYDFSHMGGAALKDAQKAGLFDDLRFFKDHVFSVDSIVGVVGKSSWNEDGIPGVDNDIFVNRTLDPVFAKKFDSGMVDSVSVGITFTKEKSHNFEDPFDFYRLLGKEIDGEIVRFLVTGITAIHELSSVAEGADPNAKRKFSNQVDQAEEDKKTEDMKKFIMDSFCESENEISNLKLKIENLEKDIFYLSSKYSDYEKLSERLQAFEKLEKKFHGDINFFASKGFEQFSEEKRKLLSFFRITGRSAFAHTLEVSTDFSKVRDLYALFSDDIERAFPYTCPSCNNVVTLSKQISKEDIMPDTIIVNKAKTTAEANVSEFCNKVHK